MAFAPSSVANQGLPFQGVRTGEILDDKGRPWREKRLGSLRVARAYRELGDSARAARCRDCGTSLVFSECAKALGAHYRKLSYANFCRERLCPMCAWRRSLRLGWLVSGVFHAAYERHPGRPFVFLTLTVRNVPDDSLAQQVDELFLGWGRLYKRKEFRRVVRGWFRGLEITHNDKNRTWHPHIHAVLWMSGSYTTGGSFYLTHRRWMDLWRESLGLDYDPWVRVQMVRPKGGRLGKVAAEVAKYTVKDSDLWDVPDEELVRRVGVLSHALRGRRLFDWGGELRKIAREFGNEDVEGASAEELVRVGEEGHDNCPVCASGLVLHVYRWLYRMQQYVG